MKRKYKLKKLLDGWQTGEIKTTRSLVDSGVPHTLLQRYQKILEKCRSNKTKRLFLYLAEKVNHPWFDTINLKKIEIGPSYQKIYPDTPWNKKYGISVPEV